jgi:2-polyprenyl-3-methyl-5-hydroxy-6-metoxy-1,4-benzoquinol methylase
VTETADDIARQRAHYNAKWAAHTFANQLQVERASAILHALHRIGLDTPPRILDLGCGSGWLTSILGHFGPATGVELSPIAVQSASRKYPHVSFEAVDMTVWEPPRGSYDVVVSSEVIEHLDDQARHLRLAHQALREGGHLILTTPNASTLLAMSESFRATWSTQPVENWLRFTDVTRLITNAGFRAVAAWTVSFGYGRKGLYRVATSHKIRRALARARLERLYESAWLRAGYGLHSVVLARRD